MPPEQKALLNTRCFFNDDGDFVVRLHDTDVFVLQRGPELAEVVKPEGDEPEPDAAEAKPEPKAENGAAQEEGATSKEAGGEEKAQEGCQSEATQEKAADRTPPGEEPKAAAAAEGAPEAGKLAAEAEPAEPPEKKARTDGGEAADAPASEAPKAAEAPGLSAEPGAEPGPGTKDASRAEAKEPKVEEKADEGNAVIVLTSGKFRTAETKCIINEADAKGAALAPASERKPLRRKPTRKKSRPTCAGGAEAAAPQAACTDEPVGERGCDSGALADGGEAAEAAAAAAAGREADCTWPLPPDGFYPAPLVPAASPVAPMLVASSTQLSSFV
mmetsp:Transcript_95066/g.255189  ORF Transcript_95066/g.255189 Transcript_95066/m.255189 type:complete len:330 (+) Transcript_95066:3295-4284(+)